ncbi:MAG: leucyl/phenylalanyl-tRNA--protein transferase [Flavobacteriales bacterium]|nr:leucyl/phenylalanyl-tRNA--protein transferase [Flavobacteriales bacterium]
MTSSTALTAIPVDVLLMAYGQGFFPMAHDDGEIHWHCPDPRAIFPLEALKPDSTTARFLRTGRYATTFDCEFAAVMRACADREETWIDERMITAYAELHRQGHAHSLEVWSGDELVGGIYGVALGAAFFGESMFGVNNAGKVAFHLMADRLRDAGFMLFDTQYLNSFTERLGAIEIPRSEFQARLERAIQEQAEFA